MRYKQNKDELESRVDNILNQKDEPVDFKPIEETKEVPIEVIPDIRGLNVEKIIYVKDANGNPTKQVEQIIMDDESSFTHAEFLTAFKNCLRFNIAGETLTPYDYRDYQKRISPQGIAVHLQNVEGQARVDQARLPINKRQAIAIGGIILILIFCIFGFIILSNVNLGGLF